MIIYTRKFLPYDQLGLYLATENPSYTEEQLILAEENFESDYEDEWEPVYDKNGYTIGYLEVENV